MRSSYNVYNHVTRVRPALHASGKIQQQLAMWYTLNWYVWNAIIKRAYRVDRYFWENARCLGSFAGSKIWHILLISPIDKECTIYGHCTKCINCYFMVSMRNIECSCYCIISRCSTTYNNNFGLKCMTAKWIQLYRANV